MTMRPFGTGRRALAAWLAAASMAPLAHAAGVQDAATVQRHAEQFLKTQTAGLPGKVSIQVTPPRATLPACAALDAFLPPGSRSIGRINVGVRCLAPTTWTAYVSAQVQVVSTYVATRHALPANHELTASDLALREGDLGALPADVATDLDAIVGHRTVSGVAAGAALRNATLRAPLVVQQGQVTRLVLEGPGFTVQSEGQALANAGRGDRVRVKTRSGQVVSGIARDGQQVFVAF